jgi:hypothetical protein
MTAYPISHIVGLDRAGVFKSVGIRTTLGLLDRGALVRDRVALYASILARTSDLTREMILDYINAADILRIRLLGIKYIGLLRASKVATVRELKYRNADNLYDTMAACNARMDMVDFLPPLPHVRRWIEHAKQLPIRITYR